VTADGGDHGGAADEADDLARLMGDVPTADPIASWFSLRMSGISAERAEENGALSRTVQNSSVHAVAPP
jgi:hypothetical protein